VAGAGHHPGAAACGVGRGAIRQSRGNQGGVGGRVMNIEMARSFFLWCTVINYGVLLLWALLFMFAHDGLLWLQGKLVRMSAEQFDLLNVAGITIYKLGIFLLNLVPCIALYIIK
jgi:hypothetical protein